MKIQTKKQTEKGIARLQTDGEIKEILVKEDLFEPEKAKVEVCFRGQNSAGIIEFSKEEIETIHKELLSKVKSVGKIKVLKFSK